MNAISQSQVGIINIIAHRGYWLQASEKNTLIAFSRALECGFGIETDLRDLNGALVVSHDVPTASAMKSTHFSNLYRAHPVNAPIALNIKSDGLHAFIKQFIVDSEFKNVFAFDMSVPDMQGYFNNKISVFTRLSEHEPTPAFLNSCEGVWLDAFESQWYSASTIRPLLKHNKKVAIVSPELHNRPHLPLWQLIRDNGFHCSGLLSICTDYPMQAKEYFYGQN